MDEPNRAYWGPNGHFMELERQTILNHWRQAPPPMAVTPLQPSQPAPLSSLDLSAEWGGVRMAVRSEGQAANILAVAIGATITAVAGYAIYKTFEPTPPPRPLPPRWRR
jgi:hypothetical protein